MQIQQTRVKVLATSNELEQEQLIPVFHSWIRESRLGDQLLIDVADYRHVPKGPGVMLIGDQGHYSLDEMGGARGLAYARKRDSIGDAAPRVAEALRAALTACEALQNETSLGGKLGFDPAKLEIHVMSRLTAPNTAASYESFRPILVELLTQVYDGAELSVVHLDHDRQPFGVRVEVTGEHTIADLLTRIPS